MKLDRSKPTVLVISQVYVPDPASVGQHMADAAAAIAARGVNVRVLASARGYADPTQKYPRREWLDGVDVVRLPWSSFGKRTILLRLVGQALFLLQAIWWGLFTPRLAAILVSTSPPMASIAALMIRFFRRAEIKFWAMDLNPDQMIEFEKIKPTSLAARAFDFLNRRLYRASSRLVVLDRFMLERMQRKRDVAAKSLILPPWTHGEHVEPVPHDQNPFRREHGLESKFVVMYSGNHSPVNPIGTIVEAALRLQHRPELHFMFVGDGLEKRVVDEAISKHAPANIMSLPYQPFDQIRYSLSAADVHLVSLGDRFVGVVHPCKVYGAMALARPILYLGPAPSHVSDLIERCNGGWRIAHGDVEGAAAVLERMLDLDRGEIEAMGARAAELIRTEFNREEMIDKFVDAVLEGVDRG